MPNLHEELRRFISTKLPCEDCKVPLCSCSGHHKAKVTFLPGEREWIEENTELTFLNGDENFFKVSGDCTFLSEEKQCVAGLYRPWECISFPLCPSLVGGNLIPTFASNCTIHPANLSDQWIADRWMAWLHIWKTIPEWVEKYDIEPNFIGDV